MEQPTITASEVPAQGPDNSNQRWSDKKGSGENF